MWFLQEERQEAEKDAGKICPNLSPGAQEKGTGRPPIPRYRSTQVDES